MITSYMTLHIFYQDTQNLIIIIIHYYFPLANRYIHADHTLYMHRHNISYKDEGTGALYIYVMPHCIILWILIIIIILYHETGSYIAAWVSDFVSPNLTCIIHMYVLYLSHK